MKHAKAAVFLSGTTAIILVLVPFHAFLTVWFSSFVGHYTLLRLWKEFLLALVVAGAIYLLLTDRAFLKRLSSLLITKLILIYVALLLIWAYIPLAGHEVSAKAMWYGLLVDLRFLVFFLAVLVIAAKSGALARRWRKILFIPAILVGAIAILQFLILPYDFLKHFGYSDSTIFPYETINHNINHIRVMSTLRGANPLGAYLILPICALGVAFFRQKAQRPNIVALGFGLLLALIFSFSRSAWIGATLGVLIVAWLSLKSAQAKRAAVWVAASVLILGGILAVALRNNTTFENVFLHTQHNSKIAVSSNDSHASAFKSAVKDIGHEPLGKGVGTAGPQSVYNKQGPTRIAENYFLQIAQEAGLVAMALFIAICTVAGKMLYERRADPLALALFASLVGISFVNLLSHAWTDDTLAYLWWGLAGIALAPAILTGRHKQNEKAKS